MGRFSDKTIAYAAERGIDEDELPLICDGCSGGLSSLYALFSKKVYCHECCNIHDIDYQIGGNSKDRKDADERFRICCSQGSIFNQFKARCLWLIVRLAGNKYWSSYE